MQVSDAIRDENASRIATTRRGTSVETRQGRNRETQTNKNSLNAGREEQRFFSLSETPVGRRNVNYINNSFYTIISEQCQRGAISVKLLYRSRKCGSAFRVSLGSVLG